MTRLLAFAHLALWFGFAVVVCAMLRSGLPERRERIEKPALKPDLTRYYDPRYFGVTPDGLHYSYKTRRCIEESLAEEGLTGAQWLSRHHMTDADTRQP